MDAAAYWKAYIAASANTTPQSAVAAAPNEKEEKERAIQLWVKGIPHELRMAVWLARLKGTRSSPPRDPFAYSYPFGASLNKTTFRCCVVLCAECGKEAGDCKFEFTGNGPALSDDLREEITQQLDSFQSSASEYGLRSTYRSAPLLPSAQLSSHSLI